MKPQNTEHKKRKILFANFTGEGHFRPLTGIAKHLQNHSYEVCWYASSFFKEELKKLEIRHFPFVSANDFDPTAIEEAFPERKLITDLGQKGNFDLIHLVAGITKGTFEDIAKIKETFDFDIIITDSLFPSIPLFKKNLGIPVIAIGVFPLPEESKDLAPYGPGLYPPVDNDQYQSYAEMRKLFNEVILKESMDIYGAILEEFGVNYKKTSIIDILVKHADLYLQVGSASFEYKRSDMGKNIRFIGSLPYYNNYEQTGLWYDERLVEYQKIILVTQGTMEPDIQKLLIPTLEAFRGTDFLVIATTAGNKTKELREAYKYYNIIIEDYVPFSEIMLYVSVFVTNGGYGGTLLGIEHNLPFVAAGVFEGKSEICARLGYFKYGIDLKTETPSPKMIKDAVETIITDSTYKNNVSALSKELSTFKSTELIEQYIEKLLRL